MREDFMCRFSWRNTVSKDNNGHSSTIYEASGHWFKSGDRSTDEGTHLLPRRFCRSSLSFLFHTDHTQKGMTNKWPGFSQDVWHDYMLQWTILHERLIRRSAYPRRSIHNFSVKVKHTISYAKVFVRQYDFRDTVFIVVSSTIEKVKSSQIIFSYTPTTWYNFSHGDTLLFWNFLDGE